MHNLIRGHVAQRATINVFDDAKQIAGIVHHEPFDALGRHTEIARSGTRMTEARARLESSGLYPRASSHAEKEEL